MSTHRMWAYENVKLRNQICGGGTMVSEKALKTISLF
jgi:hypothetical protein